MATKTYVGLKDGKVATLTEARTIGEARKALAGFDVKWLGHLRYGQQMEAARMATGAAKVSP